MYLSEQERDRRYEAVRRLMDEDGMDALLVMGTGAATGSPSYATGSFRYLTDFFIFSQYGVLLFFRRTDPIMLVPMEIQETFGRKHSWIEDVRISLDYAETVSLLLRERGLSRGRIGVISLESLPAKTYLGLRERISAAEFIDAPSLLLPLRFKKGEEEKRLMEKAALMNDGAYQEVLARMRPGMREVEVAGILEGYQRGHGADKTFNLVFSGPFPRSKEGVPFEGLPWCPGLREIQKGDAVHMEITSACGGYWNQLVRIISVGSRNDELVRFHEAAVATIGTGLKVLKQGVAAPAYVRAMAGTAESMGFRLTTPLGHFTGLDLIEGRVDAESQVRMDPGTAWIIHPRMDDLKGTRIILWGETYYMTEEGPLRLNKTDDTLHVL
jgi:Xaa-Pro aminopeptidase